MNVLLSINPTHVDNIFSGVKLFEFRRKIFARPDIRTVVVYCTKPVAKLVGEFDIEEILSGSPDALWGLTHNASGISREFFDLYFEGRDRAYALKIGAIRQYAEPLDPQQVFAKFTPPQSYMYVPKGPMPVQLELCM